MCGLHNTPVDRVELPEVSHDDARFTCLFFYEIKEWVIIGVDIFPDYYEYVSHRKKQNLLLEGLRPLTLKIRLEQVRRAQVLDDPLHKDLQFVNNVNS